MAAALELGRQLAPRPSLGAWLVSLLFDSATQPLPAGVRRGSGADRRLLFELRRADAAVGQLDVRVEPQQEGGIALVGQALVDDESDATVTVDADGATQQVHLDETGAFIARVEGDVKRLTLTLELAGLPALRLEPIELR